MNAEIITVGTEILLGDILNTNTRYLARALAELGIGIHRQTSVGDNRERLLKAFAAAFEDSDLVVTTGGLGPTADDITKEVAAEFFGQELVVHAPSLKKLEETFRDRPEAMASGNRKQALFPEGSLILDNPNGTAPGCILISGDRRIVVLPGPPHEMEPMYEDHVRPYLEALSGQTIRSRILRFAGIGEWDLAARVRDLMDLENPTVAPYARGGEAILRITAMAETGAASEALIEPVAREIRSRLKDHYYGEGEESLEEKTARLLLERGLTIATAESLTGGLVASSLIQSSLGISASYLAGYITYSNEAKVRDLKVSPRTLEQYGAVSAECAREMALGCQKAAGTDIAIATTGIAGPAGGTPEKPVGLAYIGLCYRGQTEVFRAEFRGSRNRIRQRVVRFALEKLLRRIEAADRMAAPPGETDGSQES